MADGLQSYHVTYTEQIVHPLIATPAFQLAAHIPNLEFWMSEIKHARGVLEGYRKRFEAMSAAQYEFGVNFQQELLRHANDERPPKPIQPAISQAKTDRLKHELIATGVRLLNRCIEEGFIDATKYNALRSEIEENIEI